MSIRKIIRQIIKEELDTTEEYPVVSKEEFLDALGELQTLDLEDSQVRYPKMEDKKEKYLFSGNNYDLWLLDRDSLPSSGPFEIRISDNDDNTIGFIRGTKSNNIISFNLIHIKEENRGVGIGTDIYEKFLKQGYVIKSDDEITDDTYNMYYRLLFYGFTPLLFDDGTVGLVK